MSIKMSLSAATSIRTDTFVGIDIRSAPDDNNLNCYCSNPTRLYALVPIGTESAKVEALSSYITRLASAHQIPTLVLINKEIRQISRRDFSVNRALITPALNGYQETARTFAFALAQLTGRDDLSQLTLLWTDGKIQARNAIRRQMAWCPLCFEEWRLSGHAIYIPLLWCLKFNEACLQHSCLLRKTCHACGESHHPLFRDLRIGYCPQCGSWLGLKQTLECPPNADQLRWARVAELFLTNGAARLANLSKSTFGGNILRLVKNNFGGNFALASRHLDICPQYLFGLAKKLEPGLKTLLKVASILEIDPLDLYCLELTQFNYRVQAAPTRRRVKVVYRSRSEWQRLAALAESIHVRAPSLSCIEISRRLGLISSSLLSQMLPDLSRRISVSSANIRRARHKERIARLKRLVTEATKKIFYSGKYPSVRRVRGLLPSCCDFRHREVSLAWEETVASLKAEELRKN